MMVIVMHNNDDENYQVPCKFLMVFSLRTRSSISGVWTCGMVTETLTCVAQEDCSSKAWSSLVPKRVCVVNVMRAEPVPSVGSVLLLLSALKKHQQTLACICIAKAMFVTCLCLCLLDNLIRTDAIH